MSQQYCQTIKDLRLKRSLSQQDLADKIGISRTSYISFEQGKNELSFNEASRAADALGISLAELEQGMTPNYDKYKEMIFAFLSVKMGVGSKIPKTKLAKLLYLADFSWFYTHLESMSGMAYRKIQYGPVPDYYFRVIEELSEEGKVEIDKTSEGAFLISLTRIGERENSKFLSSLEKRLINKISNKWKHSSTKDIVNFTHNQLPFLLCDVNEIMSYSLITQEDPGYVY